MAQPPTGFDSCYATCSSVDLWMSAGEPVPDFRAYHMCIVRLALHSVKQAKNEKKVATSRKSTVTSLGKTVMLAYRP
eukprot:gene11860-biopygen16894